MSVDLDDRFAQVAVLAQLGRAGGLFTYRVPTGLTSLLSPGTLVRIPFVRRQVQGIVCSIETSSSLPRVRDIAETLDPVPVVTRYQIRLARWIADYYAAPLSDVLLAMVPPGIGRKTVYVLEAGSIDDPGRLTSNQKELLDLVTQRGRVGLDDAQRTLPLVPVEKTVPSMVRRGLLVRIAELAPPRVSARTTHVFSVTDEGRAALCTGQGLQRAPRRASVLSLLEERGPMESSHLSQQIPMARASIRALVEKGFVRTQEREIRRSPIDSRHIPVSAPLDLSTAQSGALNAIADSVRRRTGDRFLLHGVTGSGKTEVYLQAVAATIETGRQAVVMVPEISLTPQAVDRFAGRFPGRVAVLHSKLSSGERLDEWQRVRHGEVDVVVGPRSALFAPLPHPGLIVVDEEHDPAYKQNSSPRYHARDAAAVLGRLTGSTVVLGSATPDVSSFQAATTGKLRLLELPDRPVWGATKLAARAMPSVEVIDLRQELKQGNRSIFSTALLGALDQTLSNRQQALLFLNRRGNATIVLCRDCGHVVRCPNCDIPFTYHSAGARLICHRCDKRAVSPRVCPVCDSPRVRYLGVGTQRVELEIQNEFPRARVLRWDRDITGSADSHDRILRAFHRHEADILVGTQMIAKGLDFPLVTLVGVISADTGLHMPDFRAPERSFQLLTQVSGRAGRAELSSRVIVQTYTPEHYAIQAAKMHDYLKFFREEIEFRQLANYPPYANLIRFVYSSESEASSRRSASNLADILKSAIRERRLVETDAIGPAPCFVARVKNRFYWQLILRSSVSQPRSALHSLIEYVPPGWSIDVDPVDLL